jgi:hypothetical protein
MEKYYLGDAIMPEKAAVAIHVWATYGQKLFKAESYM